MVGISTSLAPPSPFIFSPTFPVLFLNPFTFFPFIYFPSSFRIFLLPLPSLPIHSQGPSCRRPFLPSSLLNYFWPSFPPLFFLPLFIIPLLTSFSPIPRYLAFIPSVFQCNFHFSLFAHFLLNYIFPLSLFFTCFLLPHSYSVFYIDHSWLRSFFLRLFPLIFSRS